MKKTRFTETQILGILKEGEAGTIAGDGIHQMAGWLRQNSKTVR